jgi:hypothetical protein
VNPAGEPVMYGYRHTDNIINLPRPDVTDVIVRPRPINRSEHNVFRGRRAMATVLPFYVHGIANPKPDLGFIAMLEEGVKYRLGRRLPPLRDADMFNRLEVFTRRLILTEFNDYIDFDEELNFEQWLACTSYPEWRKEELRKIMTEIKHTEDPENFIVKVFGKDEHYYKDYKHERGIYARSDKAKVLFGPLIKKFEKMVYQHPAFIKKIPVLDRPKYITDMLMAPGAVYVATDYTSFECHISAMMMEAVEFQFYRHMVGSCGFQNYLLGIFEQAVSGRNNIINRFFDASCMARRMSGEMTTSLGNGLTNYVLMRFVCHEHDVVPLGGVVEGDDALFSFVGNIPTRLMFRERGCLVKLDHYDDVSEAGFCGNIFDPGVGDVVTDPFKQLANFGWADKKYFNAGKKKKMALLRVKALSMLYQYSGCPILSTLAKRILFLTRSYSVSHVKITDAWKSQLLEEAKNFDFRSVLDKEVDIRTRYLVERQFEIPVKAQILIEEEIENLELGAWHCPTLKAFAPPNCLHFWDNFVIEKTPEMFESFS